MNLKTQIKWVFDDIIYIVLQEKACCGYLLESPWRGDCNRVFLYTVLVTHIVRSTHNICFYGEIFIP